MKKRLLPFLAIVALLSMPMQMRAEDIPINETTFPDIYFRDWLKSQSFGQDGVLTESEIAGVTSIEAMNKGISNLKGIEFFTALTKLDCRINQLTSLDISKNTALTVLLCSKNQVTSLDVSKNTALAVLSCDGNQLTSLAVSKNTALTGLYCGNNQLASLDVLKNTALTYLDCSANPLTSLDVSKNTALTELLCVGNQLTSLDLSKNTALTSLYCGANQLTSLDISKNVQLCCLDCSKNRINETEMDKIIWSLPPKGSNTNPSYGLLFVKILDDADEQNVITTSQVRIAKSSEWYVYAKHDGDDWMPYDGDATGIGDAPLMENGPLATDSYFTLDGRKVKGEPTQKGVYIRKRHTVVVK